MNQFEDERKKYIVNIQNLNSHVLTLNNSISEMKKSVIN